MITIILFTHLVIAGFMFHKAVTTTEPDVLIKPAALLACLLWPIVIPVIFVAVQFYPDDQIEEPFANAGGYIPLAQRRIHQD